MKSTETSSPGFPILQLIPGSSDRVLNQEPFNSNSSLIRIDIYTGKDEAICQVLVPHTTNREIPLPLHQYTPFPRYNHLSTLTILVTCAGLVPNSGLMDVEWISVIRHSININDGNLECAVVVHGWVSKASLDSAVD